MKLSQKTVTLATAAFSIIGLSANIQASVVPFSFVTNASTNPSNANSGVSGDLRLDSVVINGTTLLPSQLQTVSSATIVVDNGFDVRGGHNLAAGRAINSTSDSWTTEGPATVTPTGADLASAQANFNLSSITVTRETPGTAFVDYTFPQPTNTFLYWERGIDSDATLEALDANHDVVEIFKILQQNETHTGYYVSTENGAFNITGQQLGSIGLQFSEPVSEIVITSTQYVSGIGPGNGDNGPDYKILATAQSTGAIPTPEPASLSLLALAIPAAGYRRKGSLRSV